MSSRRDMAFDVIVVGGGHAGIESACASATLGASTAMVLPSPDRIGLMPCNPAIGGPGKSQLVFEIHALGGVMARLADDTAIHSRILNASKGPAVQSLRVQNERDGYAAAARELVESFPGIDIVRGEVAELIAAGGKVAGVILTDGRRLAAKSVILCTGTFLAGVVWYGKNSREAGRQGEAPARYLSASLRGTGHRLQRFKTGTPPRIRSDSVDFDLLRKVPSDDPPESFTGNPGPKLGSSPTWLTHTTPRTHDLIRRNLGESAMYGGEIAGRGPRYCPSIEDKVVRFKDKDRHLLFVEPDGTATSEVYLQGFSSSMPPALQDEMIRTLPGFERAVIHRYAYAVEYDALDPIQLTSALMSRGLPGLFSAGQINGTSGYEEAAAQGLLAGVNAVRYAAGETPVTVRRDQGYLGVLIDDLVSGGIDEPYRMMTSRNEYRLLHRQDNARERMMPLGWRWGLVGEERLEAMRDSEARINREIARLQRSRHHGAAATKILSRPEVSYRQLLEAIGPSPEELSPAEARKVEILVKYHSYIERSRKLLEERREQEGLSLITTDFQGVPGLSNEAREALDRHKPETLGAAGRLRGIRDSDLIALLIHLKSRSVSRETSGT